MAQDHITYLLPVPSRPDGWRTWRHVYGTAAEGNKTMLLRLKARISLDNYEK